MPSWPWLLAPPAHFALLVLCMHPFVVLVLFCPSGLLPFPFLPWGTGPLIADALPSRALATILLFGLLLLLLLLLLHDDCYYSCWTIGCCSRGARAHLHFCCLCCTPLRPTLPSGSRCEIWRACSLQNLKLLQRCPAPSLALSLHTDICKWGLYALS